MNELVSIIVPIYKVEAYIKKCISSILNQTYGNFELLLIDDGSPDNCGLICDEFAKKDSRIKVFHKANGGLSDARNFGLKNATGTIISFIDGDDCIDKLFLELMLQAMNNTGCEVVECHSVKFGEIVEPLPKYKNGFSVYSPKKWLTETNLRNFISCAVWNKLYRKELFKNVLFPVNRHYEDEATTYKVIYKAKKIIRLNSALYFYRQREGSITQSGLSEKEISEKILALEEKCEYFEKNNEFDIACFSYSKLAVFMVQNFQKIEKSKCTVWYSYILKIFSKTLKCASVPIKYKLYIFLFLIFNYGVNRQ